jgi:hypothetical protein
VEKPYVDTNLCCLQVAAEKIQAVRLRPLPVRMGVVEGRLSRRV